MNKLRNKVFFTIYLILTFSLLSFIIIFNIQIYIEQKSSIRNSLRIVMRNDKKEDNRMKEDKPQMPIDDNIKFMDSTIYTILIDENNNIKEVINHSNNNMSNEEIINIATNILNSDIKDEYIGILYFEDFSYSYIKNNSLVLFDNYNIRNSLINSLKNSIIIFMLLEIFILVISKIITNWIIKPVALSFDKQKQFIADASHELKTPLSVIIASSEALEDSPNEIKWLNNIKSEANRMNLLISDLLELSITEEVQIKKNIGNLSKLVELSSLTFESIAYEKNIKINKKIENNIKFKMDENNIKQLMEILLDNAIKHSKEKTTINVQLKKINNNIELTVKNKGNPIPKNEEEKIFERFYRVDKSRDRKENRYGLGLAIAKNIVNNHNGKISASSTGGYTTFKVLFKK